MRHRRGPQPKPPPKPDPLRTLQDKWNGLSRWRRFWYGTGLLIFAMWVLSFVPARAEPSTLFYNERGQITGSASTSGNVTTFRDRQGRMSGTAERTSNGTTIFRDGQGKLTGSATGPARLK